MQAVRKIVDSSIFDNLIFLPDEMKNRKLEIIIIPADNRHEQNKDFNPEDYIGILTIENVEESIKEIREEWDRF